MADRPLREPPPRRGGRADGTIRSGAGFETFRSGGKGGQNVNKVETGIRAVYGTTGLAVVCTEERSQYANKRKAVARLQEILKAENRQRKAEEKNDAWQKHTAIVRGNAGVKFEGMEFARA